MFGQSRWLRILPVSSLLSLAQRQTEDVHKGAENEEAMLLTVCGVCIFKTKLTLNQENYFSRNLRTTAFENKKCI